MTAILLKVSKLVFVLLPCLVFICPAVFRIHIRNTYLELIGRDDLVLEVQDDEFNSRAVDLAVTSFWVLALYALVASYVRF